MLGSEGRELKKKGPCEQGKRRRNKGAEEKSLGDIWSSRIDENTGRHGLGERGNIPSLRGCLVIGRGLRLCMERKRRIGRWRGDEKGL